MATSNTTQTQVQAPQTNESTSSATSSITPEFIQQLADLVARSTAQGRFESGRSEATYDPEQVRATNRALLEDVNSLFKTGSFSNRDYGILTDRDTILNNLNVATNAAYDTQRMEGQANLLAQANLEAQNRDRAIQNARANLQTSALSGANAGQINASILTNLLTQQQQGVIDQTSALQQLQALAEKRRQTLSENENTATTTANQAAGTLGSLLNEEKNARVAAAGSALYSMGGQAGSFAGATKAREWGNTANNGISTTSPYSTKNTTKNGELKTTTNTSGSTS